jgi:hypothetical protein
LTVLLLETASACIVLETDSSSLDDTGWYGHAAIDH